MPPVYIIIVNYKRWEDTIDCLESVFRSSYTKFKIVVVDNDSRNDSIEHLKKWIEANTSRFDPAFDAVHFHRKDIDAFTDPSPFCKLTLIQNDVNDGFAAGNNVVLRLLINEDAYFWLLNPDMVIKEDTLGELVRFSGDQPREAIIGGQVRALSGNQELLYYGGGKLNYMSATTTMVTKTSLIPRLDYISGGCLFAHTSNLKRTGLLPEMYFVYWEDSDWCHWARKNGSTFPVCTTAICYDKISTAIGRGFMADYYYARNGLLFTWHYQRKKLPFVVFFNGIRFLKRLLTGRGKRAKGILRGTMDFFKVKRHETK